MDITHSTQTSSRLIATLIVSALVFIVGLIGYTLATEYDDGTKIHQANGEIIEAYHDLKIVTLAYLAGNEMSNKERVTKALKDFEKSVVLGYGRINVVPEALGGSYLRLTGIFNNIKEKGGADALGRKDILSVLLDLEVEVGGIPYHKVVSNQKVSLLGGKKNVILALLSLFLLNLILLILYYIKKNEGQDTDAESAAGGTVTGPQIKALDAATDGVLLIDQDGLSRYMNPAAISLFSKDGDADKDSIGMPWYSIFSDETQIEMRRDVLPVLKEKGEWKGEITIATDTGEDRIIDLAFNNVPSDGMLGIARDITAQKQAEKESEELRKQFFQAQKMESIGRMAGGIAHDFNNTLSAIMGYAEFLEEDLPADSMERSFAEKITAAAKQARTLINQILSFSRKSKVDKLPVDFSHLMQVTYDMINSASSSTLDLSLKQGPNKAFILANPTEISQVLMNLCVNARDAMENKDGALDMMVERAAFEDDDLENFNPAAGSAEAQKTRLVKLDETHTRVYVGTHNPDAIYIMGEISDTGTGILPAIMEQVFEPFFTTKEQDKGTGLGLSSVLGIVLTHNALMRVESIVGKGTTFRLYFPLVDMSDETLADGDASASAVIVGAEEGDQSAGEAVKGESAVKRILLVDDDERVLETSKLLIQRMGYDVTAFSSPVKALDYAKGSIDQYDMLISDYMMPEMKGGALAKEINALAPDLHVVIISGFAEESFEDSLDDYPFIKSFLSKPVEKEKIKQTLSQIFDEGEQGG